MYKIHFCIKGWKISTCSFVLPAPWIFMHLLLRALGAEGALTAASDKWKKRTYKRFRAGVTLYQRLPTLQRLPLRFLRNMTKNIKAVFDRCHGEGLMGNISCYADIFILITGTLGNAALLWLFLKERKSLSASQVLGVNLVAMDLIFLSVIPYTLFHDIQEPQVNHSDVSASEEDYDTVYAVREISSMFNLIGCPLLLACMCMERYLAILRPVLYLRVRKMEYRFAVCTVVWFVTLSFCLATAFLSNLTLIMLPVSIIISCLFILMLACLGGMVCSLQQQSPARTTSGDRAHSESPLKRRAVGNVLAVVAPTVISYLPVLGMVFLYLFLYNTNIFVNQIICNAFEFSIIFPKFGVLIGPLFYLSKARQMC